MLWKFRGPCRVLRGEERERHERANARKPLIVIGLANPGAKYRGTRHNVGAMCVDELARRTAEYARLADEWAIINADPEKADTRPQLVLVIYIGSNGLRASIALPDQTESRLERTFPSRWSLLPAVLAIIIAVLAVMAGNALFRRA